MVAAGILGPLVIGYIRDAQMAAGVPRALVYDRTMYILTGLPARRAVANALVRPVAAKWLMRDDEIAALQSAKSAAPASGSHGIGFGGFSLPVLIAWLAVGIPFLWGVWNTLGKAIKLFG